KRDNTTRVATTSATIAVAARMERLMWVSISFIAKIRPRLARRGCMTPAPAHKKALFAQNQSRSQYQHQQMDPPHAYCGKPGLLFHPHFGNVQQIEINHIQQNAD